MKTGHEHAKVLRWVADGESLQFHSGALGWEDVTADWTLEHISSGLSAPSQFRLKPRTVKIGSREVEAPVLELVAGQEVFQHRGFFDGKHYVQRLRFEEGRIPEARAGKLFASEGAAIAAYEAIVELLRGEA